jgi:hypothetical protein
MSDTKKITRWKVQGKITSITRPICRVEIVTLNEYSNKKDAKWALTAGYILGLGGDALKMNFRTLSRVANT